MALSDWLWHRLGSTRRLTPEQQLDALFDYLCQVLPVPVVRQALLADYVGQRCTSQPPGLAGLLAAHRPKSRVQTYRT
jgi:hypothetical protein